MPDLSKAYCRQVDFSAVPGGLVILRREILDYVRGLRGERGRAISAARIIARFPATPVEVVRQELLSICGHGIRRYQPVLPSGRMSNGAYLFEATG